MGHLGGPDLGLSPNWQARERVVAPYDFGISALGSLPGGWGDDHVGICNGEGGGVQKTSSRLTGAARLSLTPFGFLPVLKPVGIAGSGSCRMGKGGMGGLLPSDDPARGSWNTLFTHYQVEF